MGIEFYIKDSVNDAVKVNLNRPSQLEELAKTLTLNDRGNKSKQVLVRNVGLFNYSVHKGNPKFYLATKSALRRAGIKKTFLSGEWKRKKRLNERIDHIKYKIERMKSKRPGRYESIASFTGGVAAGTVVGNKTVSIVTSLFESPTVLAPVAGTFVGTYAGTYVAKELSKRFIRDSNVIEKFGKVMNTFKSVANSVGLIGMGYVGGGGILENTSAGIGDLFYGSTSPAVLSFAKSTGQTLGALVGMLSAQGSLQTDRVNAKFGKKEYAIASGITTGLGIAFLIDPLNYTEIGNSINHLFQSTKGIMKYGLNAVAGIFIGSGHTIARMFFYK
jgi:hypothetical protein